jgi:hypothetical protein
MNQPIQIGGEVAGSAVLLESTTRFRHVLLQNNYFDDNQLISRGWDVWRLWGTAIGIITDRVAPHHRDNDVSSTQPLDLTSHSGANLIDDAKDGSMIEIIDCIISNNSGMSYHNHMVGGINGAVVFRSLSMDRGWTDIDPRGVASIVRVANCIFINNSVIAAPGAKGHISGSALMIEMDEHTSITNTTFIMNALMTMTSPLIASGGAVALICGLTPLRYLNHSLCQVEIVDTRWEHNRLLGELSSLHHFYLHFWCFGRIARHAAYESEMPSEILGLVQGGALAMVASFQWQTITIV